MNAAKYEFNMYANGSSKCPYKFLRNPYAPITWGTGAYENYAVTCAHQNGAAMLHTFADLHFAIAMDEPTVNNMANTALVFGLLLK